MTSIATKPESLESTPEKEPSLSKMEFVRLRIPRLIPVELIEAVKGRTFTPERFIEYQERVLDSPSNFLYVLVDEERVIHGYLWAELNGLDDSLFINTFSVSKKFWGKGEAMKIAIDLAAKLKEKTGAPTVYWCSTNEKFFIKHGFKKSKIVLMEYNSN